MVNNKLENLPVEIQEKIKDILKTFDQITVYFEYGEYKFGTCIKKTYGADHRPIGTFKATDIYTENERIINYVEAFLDYPIQYKGKRDYNIIHQLNVNSKVKFNEDGNLVII